MKIVIVGCGRVGSTLAENLDAAGHEVIIFDIRTRRVRPSAGDLQGRGDPGRRHGRRGPAAGRCVRRRHLPVADRGRQPQRHGRPGGHRIARHPAGASPRSTTRSGPRPMPSWAWPPCAGPTSWSTQVATYLNLPMQTGPGIDIPDDSRPRASASIGRTHRQTGPSGGRVPASKRGSRGSRPPRLSPPPGPTQPGPSGSAFGAGAAERG